MKVNTQITDLLKDKLVFDVGCNVGRKAQQYITAGAQVIGFEPQSDLVELVRNRFKIVVENVALSYSVGDAPIWRATENGITSMSQEFITATIATTRFPEHSWSREPQYIHTNTLDNMIIKYGKPYYIKIDVEGYEFSVLQGLKQLIDIISIEFTAELIKNTFTCLNYLGSGKEYTLVYGEGPEFAYPWMDYKEISHILNSLNVSNHDWGDVYIKSK